MVWIANHDVVKKLYLEKLSRSNEITGDFDVGPRTGSVFPSMMKFELGRLVITRAVLPAASVDDISRAIDRHVCGQWGDVPDLMPITNERGLSHGGHLISAHRLPDGTELLALTTSDRLTTTVYFHDELGHQTD